MKIFGVSAATVAVTLHGLVNGQVRFAPDDSGLSYDQYLAPLPSLYNVSDSQSVYSGITNSYWTSSFIYGSDDHEYLVLSHILVTSQINLYRASVLDITDPSYFKQFTTFFNGSILANTTDLNFSFDDYSFAVNGQNRLGSMTTTSETEDVQFNITFELSSPIVLNGGVGQFQWEITPQGDTVVQEWSMPAGRTVGSLQKGEETIEIDTDKSFTWYDRQWQDGPSPSNWTWFELHLHQCGDKSESEKVSMWFFPSGFDNSTKGFATVRQQSGIQTVIPAMFEPGNRVWQSPYNYTYPLEWTIKLVDGTILNIGTTRDDQELTDPQGIFRTYEGFVNVSGVTKSGEAVDGFGIVEIQPVGV